MILHCSIICETDLRFLEMNVLCSILLIVLATVNSSPKPLDVWGSREATIRIKTAYMECLCRVENMTSFY